MSCDLFIFAGEKSGDLIGERLLTALKQQHPHLRILGVGGPRMRSVGMESVLKMEDFQVMGFIDVFLALPSLIRKFYKVARTILQAKPSCVLTIDYPGFNLRLIKYLRKQGYQGKLCHFICPSVWAWGKKRIPLMVQHLDLLLSVLPFEKNIFANTPLQVEYVGHPLVYKINTYHYKPLPFTTDKPILALFPGSRRKEIERNLSLQLQACRHLDHHLAISLSDPSFTSLIQSILDKEGCTHATLVPAEYSYELMRAAHCAIAKSGTVTLELALHRTPTVVTYGISPLDLFIAKDLLRIRLPFYCLVNIIANQEIYPELIGPNFTKDTLGTAVQQLLQPSIYATCQQRCDALISLLGNQDAAKVAASGLTPFI